MDVWGVFLTGLIAGGASCAAVQGGLLAGLVARRQVALDEQGRPVEHKAGKAKKGGRGRRRVRGPIYEPTNWRLDLLPVSGFLAGKLASHALLGALLGGLGSAVQPSFRARAVVQIFAGLVMLMLAADLLGFAWFRRLVPRPPKRFARLVRHNAKSRAAAAPALLGVATVLIPCGVTLSVSFLAIASGNPFAGAAIMTAFVLGTAPLFAILGYAARRSASTFKGQLAKLAAVAVVVAGLVSVNSGLVLVGSPVTLSGMLATLAGGSSADASGPAAQAVIRADGVQEIMIEARSGAYVPSRIQATAGIASTLILRTNGTRGCTRAFVIPSVNYQTVLPETGDTEIDLGVLSAGRIDYTCSMGMYRGSIEIVEKTA